MIISQSQSFIDPNPDNYLDLVQNEIYVDKTYLLKNLFEMKLFKRFGKTKNLTMIEEFAGAQIDMEGGLQQDKYMSYFQNKIVSTEDTVDIEVIQEFLKNLNAIKQKDQYHINQLIQFLMKRDYPCIDLKMNQQEQHLYLSNMLKCIFEVFSDQIDEKTFSEEIQDLNNNQSIIDEYTQKIQQQIVDWKSKLIMGDQKAKYRYYHVLSKFGITGKHYKKYMVIFITFSSMNSQQTWIQTIKFDISKAFQKHEYMLLAIQKVIDGTDNDQFKRIAIDDYEQFKKYLYAKEDDKLNLCLYFLSTCFKRYMNLDTIVLIDEYDTLIQQLYTEKCYNSFFQDALNLYREMFKKGIKDNKLIKRIILIGATKFADTDLFQGINIKEYNILSEVEIMNSFGFTEDEVVDILCKYNEKLHECNKIQLSDIQEWYCGYQVADKTIYNPYSIMQCLADSLTCKKPIFNQYWIEQENLKTLKNMFRKYSNLSDIFDLLSRNQFYFQPSPFINFGETNKTNRDQFFTFLLHSGYITPVNKKSLIQDQQMFKIPNLEIKAYFLQYILPVFMKKLFKVKLHLYDFQNICKSISDVDSFKNCIETNIISKLKKESVSEADFQSIVFSIFNLSQSQYIPFQDNQFDRLLDCLLISKTKERAELILFSFKIFQESNNISKIENNSTKIENNTAKSENNQNSMIEDALWQLCFKGSLQQISDYYLKKEQFNEITQSVKIRPTVLYLDTNKCWRFYIEEYTLTLQQVEDFAQNFNSQDQNLLQNQQEIKDVIYKKYGYDNLSHILLMISGKLNFKVKQKIEQNFMSSEKQIEVDIIQSTNEKIEQFSSHIQNFAEQNNDGLQPDHQNLENDISLNKNEIIDENIKLNNENNIQDNLKKISQNDLNMNKCDQMKHLKLNQIDCINESKLNNVTQTNFEQKIEENYNQKPQQLDSQHSKADAQINSHSENESCSSEESINEQEQGLKQEQDESLNEENIVVEPQYYDSDCSLTVSEIISNQKLEKDPQNQEEIDPAQIFCRCIKIRCNKLYCNCFKYNLKCNENCICYDCKNGLQCDKKHQDKEKAIEINPNQPQQQDDKLKKPQKIKNQDSIKKIKKQLIKKKKKKVMKFKGCNCQKSSCRNKNCVCFKYNLKCMDLCVCQDCRNSKDNQDEQNQDKKETNMVERKKIQVEGDIQPNTQKNSTPTTRPYQRKNFESHFHNKIKQIFVAKVKKEIGKPLRQTRQSENNQLKKANVAKQIHLHDKKSDNNQHKITNISNQVHPQNKISDINLYRKTGVSNQLHPHDKKPDNNQYRNTNVTNQAHPNQSHPNQSHPNQAHPNQAHPNQAHLNQAHLQDQLKKSKKLEKIKKQLGSLNLSRQPLAYYEHASTMPKQQKKILDQSFDNLQKQRKLVRLNEMSETNEQQKQQ